MNLLQSKKRKKQLPQPSDVLKTANDYSPVKIEVSSSAAPKIKQDVPQSDGKYGVRNSMQNAGLDNSRIGYDGEYVTYNNARVLKPDFEKDGTSYADQSDINTAIKNAYRTEGKEIAPVTDLAGVYGVPEYAFKYNNGQVYLGGRNIPSVYESDGSAYAVTDDIKEAAEWYKNSTGIKNYGDIRNDYEEYKTKINSLLDDYEKRDSWSYDALSDPAYLAYAQAAQREGEKAYENAFANMAARTGGYTNTAAIAAANAGLNYYLSQIQDKIPEFMNDSYERYAEELERDRDYISMINDMANTYFSNDMEISESAYERQRQNGMDEYDRKYSAGEQTRNSYYTDRYGEMLDLELEKLGLEADELELGIKEKDTDIHGAYINNLIKEANLEDIKNRQAAEAAAAAAAEEAARLQNMQYNTNMNTEEDYSTNSVGFGYSGGMQNPVDEATAEQIEQIYEDAAAKGYFTAEEAAFLSRYGRFDPARLYNTVNLQTE